MSFRTVMQPGPHVVVSLDFELRWGLADVLGDDFSAYRRNLEGVAEAVPALLDLFSRLGVHATWATVGALACEGWDEYEALAPPSPSYADHRLIHRVKAYRAADPAGRLHFAPALVRLVAGTAGQELGSHTFSHLFAREPGVVEHDVDADARAIASLFTARFGSVPRSFVFPRNQVAFRSTLAKYGVRVIRENADKWYWDATTARESSLLARGLRLLDGLIPMGSRTFAVHEAEHRASYFVRVNLPEAAFRLHRERIVADAAGAKEDEVLHLWAHPHNFGADPKRAVGRLRQILEAIKQRRPSARFASMGELAS